MIRDFHEFIGYCNNIDKIITNYLTFYELIEIQLGEKIKATEIKLPTRYEIIGGFKQTLINAVKIDDIMLSLVRLALEFVTLEDVSIKIRQRLRENDSYNNIKDIIFTKEMTSCELFGIMKNMGLCSEDDKYVIERIYEWGSTSRLDCPNLIDMVLFVICRRGFKENLKKQVRIAISRKQGSLRKVTEGRKNQDYIRQPNLYSLVL